MTVVSVLLGAAVEVGRGFEPHRRQVKVHLYFSTIYIYKKYIYIYIFFFLGGGGVNVSCIRIQNGDLSENRTLDLSLRSPTLYH